MTLREYAGPHLGALPVAEVETAHVVAALRPLWNEKPETASRLRGRIEAVLDFAAVHGWREGDNPARWRGHLDKLLPPPRQGPRRSSTMPPCPGAEVPAFMAALRARDGVAARALEFAILTAARTGEVLGARWPEIDLERAVWTVPEERMKAGSEHRVPLAPAAVALLRDLLPLRAATDALVFPGQRKDRPLSVMAMAMVLRRMGRGDLTVHGFRSTFRDWAGETTAHAREVVEAALAHRLGDKAEQAYARGDLFTKRRRLMEDWAEHCDKPRPRWCRCTSRGPPPPIAAPVEPDRHELGSTATAAWRLGAIDGARAHAHGGRVALQRATEVKAGPISMLTKPRRDGRPASKAADLVARHPA